MIIRTTFSKWGMCSDLSFLLRMYFDKQGRELLLSPLSSPITNVIIILIKERFHFFDLFPIFLIILSSEKTCLYV